MSYIRQLSEDLIKKIAAGEVIERPASVVKELVENSLDANAKRIEIEIERGGKYIKVADDGDGIDPEDIPLLFARHATSKINNFDDLWNVSSLGFRGEALASISSVSKVICKSKHRSVEEGFELKVNEGKIDKKSSGVSKGTIFEIDNLFYNVPAREKFLKSQETEIGHILDIVIAEALAQPQTAFKLSSSKNVILESSGSGDLTHTVVELLGSDLKDHLIAISAKNSFTELTGLISVLEVHRSNKKNVFIFVNSRPIKCHITSKAIQSAYEGLIPQGKFPIVVLNLRINSKFVDVNVHPAKREVRYTNSTEIYNLVSHSIQDTISDYYKKKYKKEGLYSLTPQDQMTTSPRDYATPRPNAYDSNYSKAAFDLYEPREIVKDEEEGKVEIKLDNTLSSTQLNIFSVNNLRCKIIVLDKPIASMTKISNKTIFEFGNIFDGNIQVVFSGEIMGNSEYQKEFFNYLSDLSKSVYRQYLSNEPQIQHKILNHETELDSNDTKRKKPPLSILEKVWDRDNWTCVYCGKYLLHPNTVKEALKEATDVFITYLNGERKEVTMHVINEHKASYDHYLPASKLPQFNFEIENLYACCFSCNRKKSNKLELKAWTPHQSNLWKSGIELAGLYFESPRKYKVLQKG